MSDLQYRSLISISHIDIGSYRVTLPPHGDGWHKPVPVLSWLDIKHAEASLSRYGTLGHRSVSLRHSLLSRLVLLPALGGAAAAIIASNAVFNSPLATPPPVTPPLTALTSVTTPLAGERGLVRVTSDPSDQNTAAIHYGDLCWW
jgi:hypothetical protein